MTTMHAPPSPEHAPLCPRHRLSAAKKAQLWIRCSVGAGTLSDALVQVAQQPDVLGAYYHDWAFLRSEHHGRGSSNPWHTFPSAQAQLVVGKRPQHSNVHLYKESGIYIGFQAFILNL